MLFTYYSLGIFLTLYHKAPSFGKLKTWTNVECNGLVYIWYHAEEFEPTWEPVNIPQVEPTINARGQWVYQGRNEFEVCTPLFQIRSYLISHYFFVILPFTLNLFMFTILRLLVILRTFLKTEQILLIYQQFTKLQFLVEANQLNGQISSQCGLGMNTLFRGDQKRIIIQIIPVKF